MARVPNSIPGNSTSIMTSVGSADGLESNPLEMQLPPASPAALLEEKDPRSSALSPQYVGREAPKDTIDSWSVVPSKGRRRLNGTFAPPGIPPPVHPTKEPAPGAAALRSYKPRSGLLSKPPVNFSGRDAHVKANPRRDEKTWKKKDKLKKQRNELKAPLRPTAHRASAGRAGAKMAGPSQVALQVHRPKSAANGKRIGEALHPGPSSNAVNKKGKPRAKRKQFLTAIGKANTSRNKAAPPSSTMVETPAESRVVLHETGEADDSKENQPRKEIVVVTEVSPRYWCGWNRNGLVTSRGNWKFFDTKGNRADVRQDTRLVDELIGWRQIQPGLYATTDDEASVVVPSPAFVRVVTPAIEMGGLVHPARDRIYHVSFLQALCFKFPAAVITESNVRAFTALGRRDFSSLPQAIQTHTIHVFCIQSFQAVSAAQTGLVQAIISQRLTTKNYRTFFQPAGVDSVTVAMDLGVDLELSSFSRLMGITDPNEQNMTDNGSFEIVKLRGYLRHGEGICGMFETEFNPHPKLYYTQLCQVRGTLDFLLYDKSGHNLSLAMSRMYKARLNEEVLRANQAQLLIRDDNAFDVDIFQWSTNSKEIALDAMESKEATEDEVTDMVRTCVYAYFSTLTPNRAFLQILANVVLFPLYLMCAIAARLMFVGLHPVVHVYNGLAMGLRRSWLGKYPAFRLRLRTFPKKAIYQRWYFELGLNTGHSYEEPIDDDVQAKFKTELAKPGKNGRLYVTYSRSILQAGWIFEYMKKAFCVVHHPSALLRTLLPGGVSLFVPDSSIDICKSLDESASFEDTARPLGLNMRIFSDDMSAVYSTETTHLYFDADISSCDAGNGFAMFYFLGLLFKLYGFKNMIQHQFRRLRSPITIRNPSNRSEFVMVRPRTIFQGSGCPETTLVNDIATCAITLSMLIHIAYYNFRYLETRPHLSFDLGTDSVRSEILQASAAAVGHVITIEWRERPAQLQFLKYSPLTSTTGEYVNTRNLGAILRNLGRHCGDLDPKKLGISRHDFRALAPSERGELYMANVVAGLCNEPAHPVMDALRERFRCPTRTIDPTDHASKLLSADRSHHRLPLSSLQERYGGEDWEWEELIVAIQGLTYGKIAFARILDQIMLIDYGLK